MFNKHNGDVEQPSALGSSTRYNAVKVGDPSTPIFAHRLVHPPILGINLEEKVNTKTSKQNQRTSKQRVFGRVGWFSHYLGHLGRAKKGGVPPACCLLLLGGAFV